MGSSKPNVSPAERPPAASLLRPKRHDCGPEPGRARLRPPSVQAGLTALATTTPGRACLRPPSVQAGLTALATTTPGRAPHSQLTSQAGLTARATTRSR